MRLRLNSTVRELDPRVNAAQLGAMRVDTIVTLAAEQGLLYQLAQEPGPLRDTIRAIAADLLQSELTEERTDGVIDYLLRVYPNRFGFLIRPVLDWLLPDKLISIVHYALFRPSTHNAPEIRKP